MTREELEERGRWAELAQGSAEQTTKAFSTFAQARRAFLAKRLGVRPEEIAVTVTTRVREHVLMDEDNSTLGTLVSAPRLPTARSGTS